MKAKHPVSLVFAALIVCLLGLTNANADTLFDAQFKERVKLANEGNKRAQYKLGIAYLRGSETKVDVTKAIHWFTKASEQGYTKAMHKLGMIYYLNKAGSKNRKHAFKWYLKAAKDKHPEATYYLGKIYFEGKLVARDMERALHWSKLAMQYGSDDAGKLFKTIKDSEKFGGNDMEHVAVNNRPRAVNKKPKEIKKTPAVKAVAKSGTFSLSQQKELVFKGSWYLKGKPAEYMPSKLNKCIPNGGVIKCKSNTIVKNNDYYNAHVEIESIIRNFTPAGAFMVDYRFNYLQVNPQGTSVGDSEGEVPKVGWQKSVSKVRCRIVAKNLVKCFTDDLRVERYYKK